MHFPLCPPVLVHSGCHYKMPQMGRLDTTPSLLTVLEAGSPRSGCQYGWVRVTDFSLYPHMVETFWNHSYEALILRMGWNPLDLSISQSPPPLMLSPLGEPGWLRWLNIYLQLRSWSQGPGIEPHIRLSAQLGAYFSLSLCLSPYLWSLSLSLSK